jgi:hypothetical protein
MKRAHRVVPEQIQIYIHGSIHYISFIQAAWKITPNYYSRISPKLQGILQVVFYIS